MVAHATRLSRPYLFMLLVMLICTPQQVRGEVHLSGSISSNIVVSAEDGPLYIDGSINIVGWYNADANAWVPVTLAVEESVDVVMAWGAGVVVSRGWLIATGTSWAGPSDHQYIRFLDPVRSSVLTSSSFDGVYLDCGSRTTPTISGCTFNNTNYPLVLTGSAVPQFENCDVSGCTNSAVSLLGYMDGDWILPNYGLPYHLISNMTVDGGSGIETLSFDPGVTVYLMGYSYIRAQSGSYLDFRDISFIDGNPDYLNNRIHVANGDMDLIGCDLVGVGVYCENDVTPTIDDCVISGVAYPITLHTLPVPTITNCDFSECENEAISIEGHFEADWTLPDYGYPYHVTGTLSNVSTGQPVHLSFPVGAEVHLLAAIFATEGAIFDFENVHFTGNSNLTINISGGDVNIINSTFDGVYLDCGSRTTPTISGCTFNNTNYPLVLTGSAVPQFENCDVSGCTNSAVSLLGYMDGDWILPNYGLPYHLISNMTVDGGSGIETLSFDPGVTVYLMGYSYIRAQSGSYLDFRDISFIDGNPDYLNNRIHVADGDMDLVGCDLVGVGIYCENDVSPLVRDCSFFDAAIGITSTELSSPRIEGCDFVRVEMGVNNSSEEIVKAENNYWGHPSGPTHPSNPSGQGVVVSDGVDFSPISAEPNFRQDLIDLSGTISDGDSNQGVQGARIVCIPNGYSASVDSDKDGYWSTTIPEGRGYRLEITAPGYEALVVEDLDFLMGSSPVLDYSLHYVGFTDYRIVDYTQIDQPDTLRIPEGATGYFWNRVEGQYGQNWLPAYWAEVIAVDASGDTCRATSNSLTYQILVDPMNLRVGGLFGLQVPASQIGGGCAGDTENLTIVSVDGITLGSENQLEIPVVIEPYRYKSKYAYRIFGKAGVGVTGGAVSAGVFAGGGSGSVFDIDLDRSTGGTEWGAFSLVRKNDLFVGAKVSAGPPKIIDVGQSYGFGASSTVSFPYGEKYWFNMDQLAGLEALTAFYLFAEPALLYGPQTPQNSTKFLSCLVRAIMENDSQDEFGVARVGDYAGLDVGGNFSAGVRFGLGTAHDVHFGVGAGLGASVHAGVSLFSGVDGKTSSSLYANGTLSGSVGPKFIDKTVSEASKDFVLGPAANLLSGKVTAGFAVTAEWQNTNWQSFRLEGMLGLDHGLFDDSINLFGDNKEWTFGLTVHDEAVKNILLNVAETPSEVWNVGSAAIDAAIDNESFRRDFLNFLEAVYRDQNDDQPVYLGYDLQAKAIDNFNLHLGLDFPLPVAPAITVTVGRGLSADLIREYEIFDGYWAGGMPLARMEMPDPPSDAPSFIDVITELWGQVTSGNVYDELLSVISNNWIQILFEFVKTEQVLSPLGSTLDITMAHVPTGEDSLYCRFYEWDDPISSQKSSTPEVNAFMREYNAYLRVVREEAAGMKYGIGGFYDMVPNDLNLLQPATLSICYADSEVVDLDESTLSVFYQDSAGAWIPVASQRDPLTNKVWADITTFRTYTLGPRMPQGRYAFTPSVPELVADGVSTAILTSDLLLHNDGQPVEDGTLFTVAATGGTILTADADTSIVGIQVTVTGQTVQVQYQSGYLPLEVTISAESVNGFARCETTLQLLDAGLPNAPVITSLIPQGRGFTVEWDSGGDADIAGYLVWFDTDGPGAPYDGSATVWGQDSPVAVGVLDSLVVGELTPGTTYYVAITALDMEGNQSMYSEEFSVAVSAACDEVPAILALDQNYPNPFNPVTKINYSLPKAGRVSLKIFDVRGRLVRTLIDEVVQPGKHEAVWQAKDDRGQRVASGVYLYMLKTDEGVKTKKLAVVR